MKFEQAVFTSARDSRVRGYHLVARSPGVDAHLAEILTRWGPSHDALIEQSPDAESINFHPADEGRFVLSRTVNGGSEYSGRGGFQVITYLCIGRRDDFRQLQIDPLALATLLQSYGWLRYTSDSPGTLPTVDVPDSEVYGWMTGRPAAAADRQAVEEAAGWLRRGERVALVNLRDGATGLSNLLAGFATHDRTELSFSTGLTPSLHRPFRIHVLPIRACGPQQAAELRKHGLKCVVAADPD